MSASSLTLLLGLVLLASATAKAQPVPELPPVGTGRHIHLSPAAEEQEPEVFVAPGQVTSLLFSSRLKGGSVSVERRELLRRLTVGEEEIFLEPSSMCPKGVRMLLRASFEGGGAPEHVRLWVVVDPLKAESQVQLTRAPRSADALWQELRQTQSELRSARAELNRLRAEGEQPTGMVRLRKGGLLADTGVAAMRGASMVRLSGRGATVYKARSFCSGSRCMVEFWLAPEDAEPWLVESATLRGRGGRRLPVWETLFEVMPSGDLHVMVEAEVPPGQPGPYMLTLWRGDGEQEVTVGGILFPEVRPEP